MTALDDLLTLSATALARRIRAGDISPTEVLEAHIDRIEAINPAINAVVVKRYEAARAEAREAEALLARTSDDARRAAGDLPPLLGVPCTVKEFLEMDGLPNTGGLMALKDRKGVREATVVSRIRRAGAIVMGLTNVPEGGLWMEADSKVYGRTNNPRDVSRSPGGSSGGEGAIVAAAGSPLGLGADIGGSIRIPSAFCGIVGHKPSGRRVPTTGHFPLPEEPLLPMLCLGPMVRKVEDCWPILQILSGPDGECKVARPYPSPTPSEVRLEDVVVYRLDTGGRPRIRKPMAEAMERCFEALEERGAEIRILQAPEIRHGVEIWAAVLEQGTPGSSYADILSPDRPMNPWWELAKLPFGKSRHTLPAVAMVAAEGLTRFAHKRTAQMIAHFEALQRRLHETLGSNGVFLFPPYTRPAPGHRMPLLTPFDGACTCTFNPLEVPSTVVPVGLTDKGLPVSVQIGSLPGHDHLTIAVAGHLEEAFGGWVPAEPPVRPHEQPEP